MLCLKIGQLVHFLSSVCAQTGGNWSSRDPTHPQESVTPHHIGCWLNWTVMGKVTTGEKALMAMLAIMSLKKGIIGANFLKIGDRYVCGHSVFSHGNVIHIWYPWTPCFYDGHKQFLLLHQSIKENYYPFSTFHSLFSYSLPCLSHKLQYYDVEVPTGFRHFLDPHIFFEISKHFLRFDSIFGDSKALLEIPKHFWDPKTTLTLDTFGPWYPKTLRLQR